jgi:SAM-dependent methyltransferase
MDNGNRALRCNLCGYEAGGFLGQGWTTGVVKRHHIVGAGYRPHAICPRCGSVDRDRFVWLFLQHRARLPRHPARLLHVAPEPSLSRALRAQSTVAYVSLDIDMSRRHAMVAMDLTRLGLASESFDVIICNHVLEHIRRDVTAMAELYRVMKPAGFGILQVPLSVISSRTYENDACVTPYDRFRTFGQDDHVRIYGWDYVSRLRAVGFDVDVLTAVDLGGPAAVMEHALIDGEPLFVVARPR